jgi:hypothetical protein
MAPPKFIAFQKSCLHIELLNSAFKKPGALLKAAWRQ